MKLSLDDLRLLGELPRPCSFEVPCLLKLDGSIARAQGHKLLVFGAEAFLSAELLTKAGCDVRVVSDLFYGRPSFDAKLITLKGGAAVPLPRRIELELGAPVEPEAVAPCGDKFLLHGFDVECSAAGFVDVEVVRHYHSGACRNIVSIFRSGATASIGLHKPLAFGSSNELSFRVHVAPGPSTVAIRADLFGLGRRFALREEFSVDRLGNVQRESREVTE